MRLGIRGTFMWAACFLFLGTFALASAMLIFNQKDALVLIASTSIPIIYYFGNWYLKCRQSQHYADFQHTMWFNQISSIGLSSGFILYLILKSWGISLIL